MTIGCRGDMWAVQDVTQTDICVLVYSRLRGQPHTCFAICCSCDLCFHQSWTPEEARIEICFANGSKYFIQPVCIEWKWIKGEYSNMLTVHMCGHFCRCSRRFWRRTVDYPKCRYFMTWQLNNHSPESPTAPLKYEQHLMIFSRVK